MIFLRRNPCFAPEFRVPEELSLNTDSDIQLRKNTRQEREGRAAEVESELWWHFGSSILNSSWNWVFSCASRGFTTLLFENRYHKLVPVGHELKLDRALQEFRINRYHTFRLIKFLEGQQLKILFTVWIFLKFLSFMKMPFLIFWNYIYSWFAGTKFKRSLERSNWAKYIVRFPS